MLHVLNVLIWIYHQRKGDWQLFVFFSEPKAQSLHCENKLIHFSCVSGVQRLFEHVLDPAAR